MLFRSVRSDHELPAGAVRQVEGAAVGERLGDVVARHRRGAFEIGQGARHPQYPVIAARRQHQPLGGALQQGAAGRIGGGDLVEQFAINFGIGADAAVRRQYLVTRSLTGAGGGDAAGDLGAGLGRRREGQVGGRDGGDVDMQVDAVEQRP